MEHNNSYLLDLLTEVLLRSITHLRQYHRRQLLRRLDTSLVTIHEIDFKSWHAHELLLFVAVHNLHRWPAVRLRDNLERPANSKIVSSIIPPAGLEGETQADS